jgi:hypothetical protein
MERTLASRSQKCCGFPGSLSGIWASGNWERKLNPRELRQNIEVRVAREKTQRMFEN